MNDTNQGGAQRSGAQPAQRPNTFLWVSLAIFGVVGLSLNAFLSPEGRAQRFAVVTTVERVLVEEVLPAQGDGLTGELSDADATTTSAA